MNLSTLFQLNYGLYIVTTKMGEEFSGCVVNTVTQITAEQKPKLTVAINKENYTCEIAKKSKKINISILSEEADMMLIGKFGFRTGREYDKLQDTQYKLGKNQIPIITQNITGYLETNVIDMIDCNTHTLFVLELQEAETLNKMAKPMTYRYYHEVVKGKTPPKASTYQKEL